MKTTNTKYAVELTYEELRLIRKACFSHERDLADDVLSNKRLAKISDDGFWADRVQEDQNEYFDTQALRSKVMDTIRDEMRKREEAEEMIKAVQEMEAVA